MKSNQILVTGASSGIGRESCRLLADRGHSILAVARRRELLESLKAEYPNQIEILSVDLRSEMDKLKLWLKDKEVDVLINNAGLAVGTESIENTPPESWRKMFETNVLSLLELSQFVIRKMIAQGGGDIVNLGSVAGFQTYPGGSIYNATKFAVRAFTEAWRKDLLGKNIRVIGIHPGMVETEFSLVRFDGDSAKAAEVYRGMRPLTALDVAESIRWAIECPRHVNIESLLIMPTDQAAVGYVHRST